MAEPTRKITKLEEKQAKRAYDRMLENPDLIMWVDAVIRRYDSAAKKRDEKQAPAKN